MHKEELSSQDLQEVEVRAMDGAFVLARIKQESKMCSTAGKRRRSDLVARYCVRCILRARGSVGWGEQSNFEFR